MRDHTCVASRWIHENFQCGFDVSESQVLFLHARYNVRSFIVLLEIRADVMRS